MVALIWIFTSLALGLWTTRANGLHALLSADPSWTANLATWLTGMPGAAWLEAWLPGWEQWVVWAMDMVHWALSWAGPVALILLWVLWALVTLPLLALALGLSYLGRKTRSKPTVMAAAA